ncbi:MAG: OmpP1/FadL family transporter [Bacteroidales bacterium]
MNLLKNKCLISLSILIFTSNYLHSQTASDGLRFSQTLNSGTARFVSMGGAFGALGSDFTSLSINPAGLGVYKSSEFTITPSFKHSNINSSYNGMSSSETKNRLSFDNVGVVLSFNPYKNEENGILNINIGFGYTRTNDFFNNSIAIGPYDGNSIINHFMNKADSRGIAPNAFEYTDDYNPFYGNSSSDWDLVMAWNTYLLFDYDANTNTYYSALFPTDLVDHENVISTKGGSGEYDLSCSINISNKLFIGATLGISDYRYTYNATYSEYAAPVNQWDSNGDRFNSFYYSQFYETTGTGYNFKIGGIYTPTPSIRIGAAIHTPTFYSFEDTYSSTLKTNFDTAYIDAAYTSKTPLGKYEYDFETPFKFIGSFAYIFKNNGLISIDVEHIDYSTMKFRNGGDGDNFTDLNLDIENVFKAITNIRIGGEYRYNDFAFRAGYAFYPSPYKKGYINHNSNTSQISGGFGYRSGNFSIDLAYMQTVKNEKYKFYDDTDLSPVKTTLNDGKFLVTLGFRF